MSESERMPGKRKRSHVPPSAPRASRIAKRLSGQSSCSRHPAPIPERPAPTISTSTCSREMVVSLRPRRRRYRALDADRDLERQLGQAARAAAAAVAGRAASRTWSACRRPSSPTTRSPSCSATSSRRRGYAVALHGEATWNGVAILSRVGLDDVVAGLAGAPGFPHPEARAVSADCGGIRVVSVYVPNGRVPGLGALPRTSSPGWPRCGRWSPPARRRRSSAAT